MTLFSGKQYMFDNNFISNGFTPCNSDDYRTSLIERATQDLDELGEIKGLDSILSLPSPLKENALVECILNGSILNRSMGQNMKRLA